MMASLYLLASDQRIETPGLQEILERTQDPAFELVFQSDSHNRVQASLRSANQTWALLFGIANTTS